MGKKTEFSRKEINAFISEKIHHHGISLVPEDAPAILHALDPKDRFVNMLLAERTAEAKLMDRFIKEYQRRYKDDVPFSQASTRHLTKKNAFRESLGQMGILELLSVYAKQEGDSWLEESVARYSPSVRAHFETACLGMEATADQTKNIATTALRACKAFWNVGRER